MRFKIIIKENWKALLFVVILMVLIFCMDYLNLPSRMGLHIEAISKDFWLMVISNFVVITLYFITFFLIDKRNLEKDKLSIYAGYCLLQEAYKDYRAILEILKMYLENDLNREIDEQVKAFLENEPLANDEKIFSALSNGAISKELFESYLGIKRNYSTLVTIMFFRKKKSKTENELFECLNKDVNIQIDKLKQLMEDSK